MAVNLVKAQKCSDELSRQTEPRTTSPGLRAKALPRGLSRSQSALADFYYEPWSLLQGGLGFATTEGGETADTEHQHAQQG